MQYNPYNVVEVFTCNCAHVYMQTFFLEVQALSLQKRCTQQFALVLVSGVFVNRMRTHTLITTPQASTTNNAIGQLLTQRHCS